jgi:hypothetical protein
MTVWANAGNFSRAQSEFGLVKVEQQRMLRNNNLITSKVMGEKDARTSEADDQRLKAADLSFKKLSADFSKEAAEKAKVGAAFQLLGTALKIGMQYGMSSRGKAEKVNWSTALKDLTNGVFSYMNKVLELQKIDAEVDAIQEDLNRLNASRLQTDDAVAALDANPYG